MQMAFDIDLRNLLNKHSADTKAATPDYILAQYIQRCLDNFNHVIHDREEWFGRDPESMERR